VEVSFERTGARRYATVVALPGEPPRRTDPAPGYDDDIPHDLVHYLVEAELGLRHAVYGRAAAGGGAFLATDETPGDPRRRAREQRRRRAKEASLRRGDPGDMARSEEVAGWCDIAWRRRAGAETPPWAERSPVPAADRAVVERVLAHLERLAPLWRDLPVGGALTVTWPSTAFRVTPAPARR
jgi:hypothetical protein